MKRPYEELMQKANCVQYALAEKIYQLGRADAERDYQNSDYWNDYLAKVIKDAKAEALDEFVEKIDLYVGYDDKKNEKKCFCVVMNRVILLEIAEEIKG